MESPGEYLKKKREELGKSLEEISQKTHIRREELRNLEADLYGFALAEVYVVGALTAYARALGLDPAEVLERYRVRIAPEEGETKEESREPHPRADRRRVALAVCAAVAVLVLVILVVVLGRRGGPARQAPPPVEVEPAVSETLAVSPPVPEPQPSRVVLELSVQDTTWVGLEIDWERRYSALLSPGAWRRWEADSVFSLTIGNAAGVTLTLDGDPVDLPRVRGKVVILELPRRVRDIGF